MKTAEQVWKEAYAKGRVDGLEEAAKVGESNCLRCDHTSLIEVCRVGQAIRAIKPPSGDTRDGKEKP